MRDFWDERYADNKYVYGTKPNQFLKEELSRLTAGRILFPGDGEGRNSVYAAQDGWAVTSVDYSENARRKALALAKLEGVKLDYYVADISKMPLAVSEFDVVAPIFLHLPPETRHVVHRRLVQSLAPGGLLIGQFFAVGQLEYASGGPRREDMLYTKEILRTDFDGLAVEVLDEQTVELSEGPFHSGPARVLSFVAYKEK